MSVSRKCYHLLLALILLVFIKTININNIVFYSTEHEKFKGSYLKRTVSGLISKKVKVDVPQCFCSKIIIRPSNEAVLKLKDDEITCSRESLAIGQHQVSCQQDPSLLVNYTILHSFQRIVAYTLFENAYHDPQNRSYIDGVE